MTSPCDKRLRLSNSDHENMSWNLPGSASEGQVAFTFIDSHTYPVVLTGRQQEILAEINFSLRILKEIKGCVVFHD